MKYPTLSAKTSSPAGNPIERSSTLGSFTAYTRDLLAREISAVSRYYDSLIQWRPLEHDDGELFDLIDCPEKRRLSGEESLPDLRHEASRRTLVLINGTFNHELDIEALLHEAKANLSRTTRLAAVIYNPYFRWAYQWASSLGVRNGEPPSTFVTRTELHGLCQLAGFEPVRIRPVGFVPASLGGVGEFANRNGALLPWAKNLTLAWLVILRPVIQEIHRPSLSVVIPARNERGNVQPALERLLAQQHKLPEMEIIFVEGNSTDGTWEEILRVQREYGNRMQVKALQQPGRGKNDAVRVGFASATKELLTILDADLTMPPELLHRFYDAYVNGKGDFVNGNRLTYPMEGESMAFLNRLGNVFFAKALSETLDVPLGDSLCGTKLLAAHDYRRIVAWRDDFGDFDPFGDFELLFPAAALGLGLVEIPVRYRARTYGQTNIHRFRDGARLAKMTLEGVWKVKRGHHR